ncbi:MAG: hypothetical protein ACE15B_18250 [Bryobacteraceae bacterium]
MLALLLALAAAEFYPFAVDQDALAGAPDFSFLNRPLEAGDRVVVRDGHFRRVSDGSRVRFFGVNLAFGANFPAAADAARIARRLRRLGVNLVRLHHMDSQPDSNPANAGSLLTTGPYPTLNAVAVERLRGFLDALSAEGIYCNLNLKVGYTFRPSVDGVPAMPAGAAFPTQSKPLHIFYPRMVELQERYARLVLAALRLERDPVLAMVEINNESSLVQAWQSNQLEAAAPAEYGAELKRQWNGFLGSRYRDTGALRAAWGGGGGEGAELLKPAGWVTEVHAPARGSLTAEPNLLTTTVTQGGAWLYVKQVGFSLAAGEPYLAAFEIRGERPGTVNWDIKQDVSPWRTVASRGIAVTAEWQRVAIAFQPGFAVEGIGRFALDVGAAPNTYFIRNWSLRQTARRGLGGGETLEAGTVALPGSGEISTEARTNDYLLFLADRDRAYLERMAAAVRETAGADVPVAGTQMGFGGLLNLETHAGLDYQDNHFYVDHYNFPNVAWDSRDWRMRDQSSLGSGLAAFFNVATTRESWRPFTLSEYNQPWPNRYAAEIDPTLAAFAAFQDWDGLVHFAYSHGRGWDDGVPNGFNINGDWTKWPNLGQSAWLFRTGAVRPGIEYVDIPVSTAAALRATRVRAGGSVANFLRDAFGYDPAVALIHRVGVSRYEGGVLPWPATAALAEPLESDTGELLYDRAARLFLIRSGKAAGVFGFLEGPTAAGLMTVEAGGFVAALLTPLDGKPLAESSRMLLSAPGYALRSQPGEDPPRPQQIVNYGATKDWWTLEPEPAFRDKPSGNLSGGQRPTWMSRLAAWITLPPAVTVYPLDGAGRRMAPLRVENGRFALADSPWYEVVRRIE